MRPKPVVIAVTSSEDSYQMGVNLRNCHIKNNGADDVLINFDAPTDSNSYLLEAGEQLTVDFPFVKLYYRAVTSTATLYIIRVNQ